MDFIGSSEESLVLYAVVVYQTDSVDEPNNQFVPLVVNLHSCDVIMGLLPVYHFPLFHVPNPNHFVKAARDNVMLRVWLHEEGWAKDVWMLKDLDGLIKVYVPNYHKAVSAHWKQVGAWWIFGGPVYLKNVRMMEVIPFFVWLRLQQRNVLPTWCVLTRLNILNLPDSQNMVLPAGGHKFPVFSKFDNPNSAVVILQFDSLLKRQVVQVVVSFFVESRSYPVVQLELLLLLHLLYVVLEVLGFL